MPKRTELRGETRQVPKQRARCESTLSFLVSTSPRLWRLATPLGWLHAWAQSRWRRSHRVFRRSSSSWRGTKTYYFRYRVTTDILIILCQYLLYSYKDLIEIRISSYNYQHLKQNCIFSQFGPLNETKLYFTSIFSLFHTIAPVTSFWTPKGNFCRGTAGNNGNIRVKYGALCLNAFNRTMLKISN